MRLEILQPIENRRPGLRIERLFNEFPFLSEGGFGPAREGAGNEQEKMKGEPSSVKRET